MLLGGRTRSRETGSMLVTGLIVVTVLIGISGTLLVTSLATLRETDDHVERMRARYAAESGIAASVLDINNGRSGNVVGRSTDSATATNSDTGTCACTAGQTTAVPTSTSTQTSTTTTTQTQTSTTTQSSTTTQTSTTTSTAYLEPITVTMTTDTGTRETVTVGETTMETQEDGTFMSRATVLPDGSYLVRSFGTYNGRVEGVEMIIRRRITSPFTRAMFSDQGLNLTGNARTDSYDSEVSSYSATPRNTVVLVDTDGDGVGDSTQSIAETTTGSVSSVPGEVARVEHVRRENGDVGTNSSVVLAVTLTGNAVVVGDASPGPGGSVGTTGNSFVSGSTAPMSQTQPLDPVVFTRPPANDNANLTTGFNASTRRLTVQGNDSLTIPPGTYDLTRLGTSGNGVITVSGEVTIYVSESFSLSGNGGFILEPGARVTVIGDGPFSVTGNGIINRTSGTFTDPVTGVQRVEGLPTAFVARLATQTSSGPGSDVNISGNGNFFGAIYAPNARVNVSGNGETFGSVVGRTISVSGNGTFHFDEALARLQTFGRPKYTIFSQREVQPGR